MQVHLLEDRGMLPERRQVENVGHVDLGEVEGCSGIARNIVPADDEFIRTLIVAMNDSGSIGIRLTALARFGCRDVHLRTVPLAGERLCCRLHDKSRLYGMSRGVSWIS